ncbi:MAG: glycosyl hydrolase family 18 protein [Butyribacter sp.]|nr:glycosyl hydrolase family 18 protein [bacterium]MDY3855005.1 glycosyl hydrolase family 18 protein [Butyribacter sp.]
MKKNKNVIIAGIICIAVLGIIVGSILYHKFSPSKEMMKLTDYFQTKKDTVTVILGDEICDTPAVLQEKEIYLPVELVKEKLNTRFYWDKNENVLLYTTPNAVISAEAGSRDCYKNNSKSSREYEIVRADAETVYVALDYVKEYTALEYKIYNNPKRVVVTYEYNKEKEYIKAETECALRYKPDIKSDILVKEKEGTVLRLLEKENPETGFCKVMDQTGVIGYIRSKDLGKVYKEKKTTDFREEEYTHILKDEKINLVWHQVTNQTANSKLLNMLSNAKGVNVVCPTWFATSDNNGNIDSLASDTYVTQAHQAGIEVWGLCNDFSPNMKIGKVLGSTSKRQKLAKNLIAEAIRYSLDGINIDFENVKKESGEDFIQFIREIGIMCRNNGIVLSIDNYPVAEYSQYYNRTEQANVADYVITMAYDEYYSGSEEAGPVSSLSYVKNSVKNILEQVPANQSIIALPFYSRHWTEKTKNGKVILSSEACSMSYAQELLSDSKTKANWDDAAGMNYLEYTKGKAIHKMWIEDINSLQLKMEEVAKNDTAGVAFWKLGMEDKSVWDMIYKYNK